MPTIAVMTCRVVVAIVAALSAFACAEPKQNTEVPKEASSAEVNWTLGDVPYPVDSASGVLTIELSEVNRYGTEEGNGWLPSFRSVAASDTLVAVGGGFRDCEVVVFHRASERALARFGQCGGGPQELQQVSVLSMKGDSVAIVDRGGRRLQLFTPQGNHVRSETLHDATDPTTVSGMFDVAWAEDSLVAYVVKYGGHGRRAGQTVAREADSPFVRVHAVPSGRRLAVAGVEGSGVGRLNFDEEREMSACLVAKGTKDGRAALVVFNRWAAQVVAYDVDSLIAARPAVIMNRIVRELPFGAFPHTWYPGKMTAHYIHARCGERLALGQYRRFEDPDSTVTLATSAYLVAVAPGTAEHGVIRTEDERLLGRLLAGRGDTFFFGHRERFAYPVVIAASLRTKPKQ